MKKSRTFGEKLRDRVKYRFFSFLVIFGVIVIFGGILVFSVDYFKPWHKAETIYPGVFEDFSGSWYNFSGDVNVVDSSGFFFKRDGFNSQGQIYVNSNGDLVFKNLLGLGGFSFPTSLVRVDSDVWASSVEADSFYAKELVVTEDFDLPLKNFPLSALNDSLCSTGSTLKWSSGGYWTCGSAASSGGIVIVSGVSSFVMQNPGYCYTISAEKVSSDFAGKSNAVVVVTGYYLSFVDNEDWTMKEIKILPENVVVESGNKVRWAFETCYYGGAGALKYKGEINYKIYAW